ncbi:SAM-dependent methyltransferase [Kineosphaera limosa]|uniref:Putative methyltransferase n=1 Tax=Kineosphaera limosa NBRC 100340 TaxID=1184609 RepID=K6VMV9_9MICO|nr:class I SAM-dependent methyltransferase [Kineosphaera limosa]NYE00461.1 SAM-dependent methyltransferase [Kineosphaera limosa]GAB97563.1 putative methyltransferase [Kineosphaera limosa NBRC 100340]
MNSGDPLSSDSGERPHWAGMAPAYARGLADVYAGAIEPILDTVAERVPLSGAQLLDVGSGTGRLTAAAVQRGARVTSVDPAEPMRELTAQAAPSAQVLAGAAPGLPVEPGLFDAVVSNFLLEHALDPRAVLADFVRAGRSGAVVAATIWAPDAALQRLWGRVAAESQVQPVSVRRIPEHLDFAHTGTGLAGLFDAAGLEHIEMHTVAWISRVEPEDLWAAAAAGIGVLGHLLVAQDEETTARAKQVFERVFAENGELVCEAILAVGTKP